MKCPAVITKLPYCNAPRRLKKSIMSWRFIRCRMKHILCTKHMNPVAEMLHNLWCDVVYERKGVWPSRTRMLNGFRQCDVRSQASRYLCKSPISTVVHRTKRRSIVFSKTYPRNYVSQTPSDHHPRQRPWCGHQVRNL